MAIRTTLTDRLNPFAAYRNNQPAAAREFIRRQERGAGRPEPVATDNQHTFVAKLVTERDTDGMNDAYRARISDILAGRGKPLTKAGASTLIDGLLTLPHRSAPCAPAEPTAVTVPAGRYALDGSGVNETVFYRVDRPEEGKWAGYTFVSRLEGPSEERVPRTQKEGILARIAEDPAAASARYGREIGACGVCGRRLTNDDSRAAGIGPVCASKMGW